MEAFLKARGFKGAGLRTMLERIGHGDGGEIQLDALPHDDPTFEADLAWHVRVWGRWVLARARKGLAPYYPTYAEFEALKPGRDFERRPMRLLDVDENGIPKIDSLNAEFVDAWLKDPRNPRWVAKPTVAYAMKPERYARCPERFEPMRMNLNRAVAFAGLAVDASGELSAAERAWTLSDAERRAQELRQNLTARGVHPDVLRFCRAELVAEDYFHAVLEATKSIADKMRNRTGLDDDGAILVDRALGGDLPMLAVNAFHTESEKGEQRGFANLVKGVFGMFRNPTAHVPRIHWAMNESDAEDLLSLASLIHRRLDSAQMPTRA